MELALSSIQVKCVIRIVVNYYIAGVPKWILSDRNQLLPMHAPSNTLRSLLLEGLWKHFLFYVLCAVRKILSTLSSLLTIAHFECQVVMRIPLTFSQPAEPPRPGMLSTPQTSQAKCGGRLKISAHTAFAYARATLLNAEFFIRSYSVCL